MCEKGKLKQMGKPEEARIMLPLNSVMGCFGYLWIEYGFGVLNLGVPK
jgi:hypothetical protein